jgi:hypothetical protein
MSADLRAVMKACTAIACFGITAFLSIPYSVRWSWRITRYDGDVPFWTVVFLERINALLFGAGPFGVALAAATLRGHLRGIPLSWLLVLAMIAGALWKALPWLLGGVVAALPKPLAVVTVAFGSMLTYYAVTLAVSGLLERRRRQSTRHASVTT